MKFWRKNKKRGERKGRLGGWGEESDTKVGTARWCERVFDKEPRPSVSEGKVFRREVRGTVFHEKKEKGKMKNRNESKELQIVDR